MIGLKELAEILKSNENIEVVEVEEGLLLKEVSESGVAQPPLDLVNFVKVYEQNPNITVQGNKIVIESKTFSSYSLMMLLMSVFANDYDFEATGDYEVTATPKVSGKVQESETKTEIDFTKIAEEIDQPEVEIEVHEDGLKVECLDVQAFAEKVDKKYPDLSIEIYDDYILIGE